MKLSTIWFGLGLGLCTFGLTWGIARHYTGLAREGSTALAIAIVLGIVVGLGYVLVESRLFDAFKD